MLQQLKIILIKRDLTRKIFSSTMKLNDLKIRNYHFLKIFMPYYSRFYIMYLFIMFSSIENPKTKQRKKNRFYDIFIDLR